MTSDRNHESSLPSKTSLNCAKREPPGRTPVEALEAILYSDVDSEGVDLDDEIWFRGLSDDDDHGLEARKGSRGSSRWE